MGKLFHLDPHRDRGVKVDVTQNHFEVDLTSPNDLGGVGETLPIKKLQPGEVLDVVIKMRQLMAMYETAAFTLYASFSELGDPMLEREAEKTRHTLELATARMASLLATIEKTPAYVEIRRVTLEKREERRERNSRNVRGKEK